MTSTDIDIDIETLAFEWPDLGQPTRVLQENGGGVVEWRLPVVEWAVLQALEVLGRQQGIPDCAILRLWYKSNQTLLDFVGPRIEREMVGIPENVNGQLEYAWRIHVATVLPGVSVAEVPMCRGEDGRLRVDRRAAELYQRWLHFTCNEDVPPSPTVTVRTTLDGGWFHKVTNRHPSHQRKWGTG